MKNKVNFVVGAVAGMGIYALAEKYAPNMITSAKNTMMKLKKETTKKIDEISN